MNKDTHKGKVYIRKDGKSIWKSMVVVGDCK